MTNQPTTDDRRLKPFEAAARIYCTKLGVDPDESVAVRHPLIVGMTMDAPMWHEAAERLIDLSRMLAAMGEAKSLAAVVAPKAIVQ